MGGKPRKPRVIRVGKRVDMSPYPSFLDPADTIYVANYFLGYFKTVENAAELMRLQKIEDLKKNKLWNSYQVPFKDNLVIDSDNFGINVYAVGTVATNKSKMQDYEKLLCLTSSHINYGGWTSVDFVVTYTTDHTSARLIDGYPQANEFILGFIRLDAGVLNNKPLFDYLGVNKLTTDFANNHLVSAKVIVATQPFGSLLRGGKLIALLSTSNELKNWFNKRFDRNVVVFYTTSLYGSSKSSSQYDMLDRYIKYIGDTLGTTPLRMKEPHNKNILEWLDGVGVSKYLFDIKGSSKSDRSFREMINYIKFCLWKNSSDPNISVLRKEFETEMNTWIDGKTERKRTYVSIYGQPTWDQSLISPLITENHSYDLDALFKYWKTKVFKDKSWGLRKVFRNHNGVFTLGYDLLNQQLKQDNFNQVR